jgi:steroid 5-alpha reductase family enzyme
MLIWLISVIILFSFLTLLWVISLIKKDVSIVDPAWSLGIFFIPLFVYLMNASSTSYQTGVILLVAAWALRLSIYLIIRNWGHIEDKRYTAFRNQDKNFKYTSLFKIFWLQGLLMCLVAIPLSFFLAQTPTEFLMTSYAGYLIAFFGFIFESIADIQLMLFKRRPENTGKVMDQGLWGISRHPNYFGEFVFWWGIYILTLPAGWYVSWISPVLVSFLLLRVSGVTLTEKQMSEKKDFEAYRRTVPSFFPRLFKNRSS